LAEISRRSYIRVRHNKNRSHSIEIRPRAGRPDRLLVPSSLLSNGYRNVKVTSHHQLVTSTRSRGAIPPRHHAILCSTAKSLNKSCTFLYLLLYTISRYYSKWKYCRSYHTSSCGRHVVITDCRKLQRTRLRWLPNA